MLPDYASRFGMQVAAVILSSYFYGFYGSSWEPFTFWEYRGDCVRLLCRWMPLGYTSSPATRQGWSITWIGIVCSALDCRLSRVLPFPQKLIGTHWNMWRLLSPSEQVPSVGVHDERSTDWCIDRMVLLAVCSSGKPMWITEIACSDPNSPERLSAEVG